MPNVNICFTGIQNTEYPPIPEKMLDSTFKPRLYLFSHASQWTVHFHVHVHTKAHTVTWIVFFRNIRLK